MADVLLALSIPFTFCAAGVYAVCDGWWRRRRPAQAAPYPAPCTHAAARAAEREMLVAAAEVVDAAHARFAGLYDAHGDAGGIPAGTDAMAVPCGADAERVTAAAGSSAGHGPSSPAPARTPKRPPAR